MHVPSRKRRALLQVEPLENRLVPAAVFSGKTLYFQDTDGDTVKVQLSKSLLTNPALDLDEIFRFDVGTVDGDLSTPQHLNQIDLRSTGLSGLNTVQTRNLSITVSVTQTVGDGLVNVGELLADTGLGVIKIGGDLSKVVSGDGTRGMTTLQVRSIGVEAPLSDLVSTLDGNIVNFVCGGTYNQATFNIHGAVTNLTVAGNVVGGTDDDSGSFIIDSNLGTMRVIGNIQGSDGLRSGRFNVGGRINAVFVNGNVSGGISEDSGQIQAGGIIGPTHMLGLTGNDGDRSGSLRAGGGMGFIVMGGNIRGGNGNDSGQIVAQGRMAGLRGWDIIGGGGDRSGSVRTQGFQSHIITMTIGSIRGGTGNESGAVIATGGAKITINGDIIGGTLTGGLGHDVDRSGYVQAYRLAGLFIRGSIRAGVNEDVDAGTNQLTNSGAVRVENDIVNLTVLGNVMGSATNRVVITSRGQVTQGPRSDVALGSMAVKGFVKNSDILLGYDITDDANGPTPSNPDAQAGAISIGGGFMASNLVAGIDMGADGYYGTDDDFVIINENNNPNINSKFSGITIKGALTGTPGITTDHFGITAEWIVKLQVNNQLVLPFKFNPGPKNNTIFLGTQAVLDPGDENPDVVAAEVGSFPT